jgi:kynureninase
MTTVEALRALDAADPLRHCRDRFFLPLGTIYLDGNSLGVLPKATVERQRKVVAEEWGSELIRSWNSRGWIDAPARVGAKIARLIGARPHEVIVADSVSVNLFKLIVAAAALSPGRRVLLSEAGNFHTDLHIASGAAELAGPRPPGGDSRPPRRCDRRGHQPPPPHPRSFQGRLPLRMAEVTARAKAAGARTIWDLSHSAGAVPLDLNRDGAELAVGCGYKYLNGGPGAPAFLYVAEHLQEQLVSPLRGWMGHAAPFAFTDDYVPAPGIARFLVGTPPILSLSALESGVDSFDGVDMDAVWVKSVQLSTSSRACRGALPPARMHLPAEPEQRGSHISFRHPHAFEICQALIADGVIGDFRAPDVVRFGLTPAVSRFRDIWLAVERMAEILGTERWREPRFAVRGKVT